ncbi:DUF3445 domain-containing protein [Alteribacillus sp. YIM 98480]|uniref:heme-dependent oxidative N-demethylase family protein n=1 Tax=Alteribacillus sp. YIM 98480 TaxID=2606599 RepID=UPI00131BDE52|nr:DUF3445 domain-containing protein [Alteribacillus sp. YIM 98480]
MYHMELTSASRSHAIPSQPLIDRFPFPFKEDKYRYSNNSKALESPLVLDITPEYFEEVKSKRDILAKTHNRAYQALSHSMDGQWEILENIIEEMVEQHPGYFGLEKDGDIWTFYNYLLEEQQTFTLGDPSTLPYEPLDFIGRHVQEDLIYIGHRNGDLYMDAGQLCFPANWSIAFNLGMTYTEFHSPVPHYSDSGLAEKVRNFLLRMEAGKPWTRLNWTLTVDGVLPTFPEIFDEWGTKANEVTVENAGERVYLRVEDQKLFRLPRSYGILFGIHTHLISVEELCKKQEWAVRFCNVLEDLPDYMAEYKGFLSYKPYLVQYLKNSF